MKRKILVLSLLALSLTACTPTEQNQIEQEAHVDSYFETETYEINFPNLRTAEGIYHDYMTIETADGNLWELGDEPDSRYLDENGNAIFTEGEKVIVLFDMWGEGIEDDFILDVHSLEY